jgi:hypothetical protein
MKNIKYILLVTMALLFVNIVIVAQDVSDEIRWIKKDYAKSDVVARIKITEQKLVDSFGNPTETGGGYASYLVTGKVIKSFKGKFEDEQDISFIRTVEGLREGQLLREEIYFLKFSRVKNKPKMLYETEENSNRPIDSSFEAELLKLKTKNLKMKNKAR